jgi:hypothetical protein
MQEQQDRWCGGDLGENDEETEVAGMQRAEELNVKKPRKNEALRSSAPAKASHLPPQRLSSTGCHLGEV